MILFERVGIGRACVLIATLSLLSACQQSVQGQKLDINYADTTGLGSVTGGALKLPHGRYTFFSYADPPDCVKSVALLDRNGRVVVDDASWRRPAPSPPPGAPAVAGQQMVPTMVQQELSTGPYRVRVTAKNGCAWEVQQILNYVLGSETPLKAAARPIAPSLDVRMGNATDDPHFHIDGAGIYDVRWSVTPCDRYSGDLVRPGSREHLGDGSAAAVPPGGFVGPQGMDGPMFLGAGDWTARVSTRCFWEIEVSPWRGSLGGGAQGFTP